MTASTPKAKLASRSIARFVERVLAMAGLLFIIYHGGFNLTTITSPSMSPTLEGESFSTGDWVLTCKLKPAVRMPKRWELVQFRDSEGMFVIKRVVGLPGERIQLKDGRVVINDKVLDYPNVLSDLKYYPFGNLRKEGTVACENGFYVLGDKSNDSNDSRFEGPVKPEVITGRPLCIVWPLTRLRFLNP